MVGQGRVCEETHKWARAWASELLPKSQLPGTQGTGVMAQGPVGLWTLF